MMTPFPSAVAETVGATQPGREQCQATCLPSLFLVGSLNSSLLPAKILSFSWALSSHPKYLALRQADVSALHAGQILPPPAASNPCRVGRWGTERKSLSRGSASIKSCYHHTSFSVTASAFYI